MYTTEHLKKLLSDFIEGRISREDAEELFEIINHHDVDGTFLAWLYKKWEESPVRSRGFYSEVVFEKVRKNLNLPLSRSREEMDYVNYMIRAKSRSNKRIRINLLKYAAVFIFAVLSSYFTFRYLGNNSTGNIYRDLYKIWIQINHHSAGQYRGNPKFRELFEIPGSVYWQEPLCFYGRGGIL